MRHLLFLLILACSATSASAQEPTARTLPEDPGLAHEVDTNVLKIALRPLTKEESQVEIDAWLQLVHEQAEAISAAEISVVSAEDPLEISTATAEAASMRSRRDMLIERARIVARSLEAKGGDVEDARKYLKSVVGLPPVTGVRAMWTTALAWLQDPNGGITLGIRILKFLGVLLASAVIANLVARIVRRALGSLRSTSDLLRDFLVNSIRRVVLFIGFVFALSMLNVDVGPFLAAIGAAGFVIGFALQGTLSNFASGVMIMLYRPYDVGDFVNAAGVSGTIDSMNLVSTTIKTPDNQTIIVPNNSIWGGVITNVTFAKTRRVDMKFGIGYTDDIDKAKTVLTEIVRSHEKTLDTPEPVVRVHELADSSINIVVRVWTATSDYWGVYWDVTEAVKKRFDEAGVSIPFPQRDVHLFQEPATSA